MGETLTLAASDGHQFGAYRADANGAAKGGIIVLQEIFGVNQHIREVCDGFAAEGYAVIAPALYDRSSKRDCALSYTAEDVAVGRALREEFSWDDSMLDVEAAAAPLRQAGLKIATVGYCWGGTISFMAGCRLDMAASVVYYGGQILPYRQETARAALLMHFGAQDQAIPLSDVEQIRQAQPQAEIHIYDADHGFNCDHRRQYDAKAAALARQRTLACFAEHLG